MDIIQYKPLIDQGRVIVEALVTWAIYTQGQLLL